MVAFTTRQIGPCFAAEVSGLNLREPLSQEDVTAIHAAMDEHAVLVFHDQHLSDEQHLAFSRSLGELEAASGTSLREADEYRLPTTFAAVSNLVAARRGDSVQRRQYGICRHARGRGRLSDLRALADLLAPVTGFTDFTEADAGRIVGWRVGDLVMWDNRRTMHRSRPFPVNEPRDVRRTTLVGDGPTAEQAE